MDTKPIQTDGCVQCSLNSLTLLFRSVVDFFSHSPLAFPLFFLCSIIRVFVPWPRRTIDVQTHQNSSGYTTQLIFAIRQLFTLLFICFDSNFFSACETKQKIGFHNIEKPFYVVCLLCFNSLLNQANFLLANVISQWHCSFPQICTRFKPNHSHIVQCTQIQSHALYLLVVKFCGSTNPFTVHSGQITRELQSVLARGSDFQLTHHAVVVHGGEFSE